MLDSDGDLKMVKSNKNSSIVLKLVYANNFTYNAAHWLEAYSCGFNILSTFQKDPIGPALTRLYETEAEHRFAFGYFVGVFAVGGVAVDEDGFEGFGAPVGEDFCGG